MLAIHCISATEACTPSWIAGSATLITDASRDAMLEPRTVAVRTQRFACEAHPGVSGAPRMTPASHGGDAMLSTARRSRQCRIRSAAWQRARSEDLAAGCDGRRGALVAEERVERRHHLGALANGSRDTLDRTRPHVADREDAVPARLERATPLSGIGARAHE